MTGAVDRMPLRRVVLLVACGASLVACAPALGDVYGETTAALGENPMWLGLAAACEAVGFISTWRIQSLAMNAPRWSEVATAQLAGNAISNLLPAGSAMGAVVQLRLLRRSGIDFTTAAASLVATGLLGALSGCAVFAVVLGVPVGRSTILDGGARWSLVAVAFAVVAGAVTAACSPRVLAALGRWIGAAGSHVPGASVMPGLSDRLVAEQARLRATVVAHRGEFAVVATGRVLGDYLALYAAMLAVGARPSPILVLLAFTAANVAGAIPLTPGGFGFVEAGLAGALGLVGLSGEQALVTVAVYRLVSFWLPITAGAVAYGLSASRAKTLRLASLPLEPAAAVPLAA